MFTEPGFSGKPRGWIEVICGSMFSGKSEELIRRLRRATIANQRVEVFKPKRDTRYSEKSIVSHDSNSLNSTPVEEPADILRLSWGCDVVGIDEAQFFPSELITVCEELALRGARVILAGLDKDYLGRPFGPMPELLCVADYLTKLHAICMRCGNLATHSYRLGEEDEQFLLGSDDQYEPRCRTCFHQGEQGKKKKSIEKSPTS